ncbi:hypothetical protein, partial [Leuconostoc mesenteroides]|uniref:hypothetical protein n=1 Tax=Leuconostoc mesenteroides TaxID=1245 RepID=UPI00235F3BB8
KKNWAKIKKLWLTLSKRYMVKYGDLTPMEWLMLIQEILQNDVLQVQHSEQIRQRLTKNDDISGSLTVQETKKE